MASRLGNTGMEITKNDLDHRFTHGLLFDVFRVLEQHGYALPTEDDRARNRAHSGSLVALGALVREFEGRA